MRILLEEEWKTIQSIVGRVEIWKSWISGVQNWHEQSALQSVTIRRSTGNDNSGPLFLHFLFFLQFWHERSALQSVAVRRSTGNDVSGHYCQAQPQLNFNSILTSIEAESCLNTNFSSHPPTQPPEKVVLFQQYLSCY